MNVRIRRQHHHLYSLACILHSTIRVWGLFLVYLRSGFVRTSFGITKNGLHTFFVVFTLGMAQPKIAGGEEFGVLGWFLLRITNKRVSVTELVEVTYYMRS